MRHALWKSLRRLVLQYWNRKWYQSCIFTVTLKFQILLYFDFNISIISSEILATLCCAIHGSINSKCASRERRGSKHDEGLRKIYSEKKKETQRARKRGATERNKRERRKRETLSSGSSRFLGVQRSLYGQAIFMTKPPGRAEVTREVTRCFRHVIHDNTRRYSHSSPGKENDSSRVL